MIEQVRKYRKVNVGIDWVSAIWKHAKFRGVANVLGIPYSEFTPVPKRKQHTEYTKCYEYGDIRVFTNERHDLNKPLVEGCALELSGEGCRQLELILKSQNRTWQDFLEDCFKLGDTFYFKVNRIDIAIDDRNETPYFTLPQLIRKARKSEYISRSGSFKVEESSFEKGVAQTLYIGSPKSELRYRFYEKDKQLSKETGKPLEEIGSWIRIEIQMRREMAHYFVVQLARDRSDFDLFALELLNKKLRFVVPDKVDTNKSRWKTWRPWERFIGDVKDLKLVIERENQPLFSTEMWIKTSVAPVLKLFQLLEAYDALEGLTDLSTMIDKARLSDDLIARVTTYLIEIGKVELLPVIEREAKNPTRELKCINEGGVNIE